MTEATQPQRTGLTAITIENFKGISDPVTIPLRPITLLFGANSAGKSTVLQALLYALEVLEGRNPDVDKTELGGETIDLGGFANLVHKHDLGERIRIELHYQGFLLNDRYLSAIHHAAMELHADITPELATMDVTDYMHFETLSVAIGIGWNDVRDRPMVTHYEVALDGSPFAVSWQNVAERPRVTVNLNHPYLVDDALGNGFIQGVLDRILMEMSGTTQIPFMKPEEVTAFVTQAAIRRPDEGATASATETQFHVPSVIPKWGEQLRISSKNEEAPIGMDENCGSVLSQLICGAGESVLHELRRIRYLGPLREVPQRRFFAPRRSDRSRWANGMAAWDTLTYDLTGAENSVFKKCSSYLEHELGLGYRLHRDERIQLPKDGSIMARLNLFATNYEEYDAEDFQEHVLEPLSSLPRVPFIQLMDERTGLSVEPRDVGVGVSQAIPVVVGAVEPSYTIFAIEQPELHIHPAVQVGLGDVFLKEGVLHGQRTRTLLVETHSEHLVLRIMRRMRETSEGTLPPDFPEVTPEDVAILLVEVIDGRTIIREMPLNERGELVKAWPGGFFEEALRETL